MSSARRRYGATVSASGRPSESIVTVDGSTFLEGLICTSGSGRFENMGCDQFFLFDEGASRRFSLENNNDEAHGGHLVERMRSAWMEIIGEAGGAISSCQPGLEVTLTPEGPALDPS